jgi:hypothetical protein
MEAVKSQREHKKEKARREANTPPVEADGGGGAPVSQHAAVAGGV